MEKIKLEKTLIYRYSVYLNLTESKELKRLVQELLSKCEYEVLNFIEHHFSPVGYTCVWLLGESHLAVHTFPERGTSYVELSSCSKKKNEKFKVLLESQHKYLV
ncbi:MAG: S-adenosylmethionine decarboxylase [Bacteroidota bacterium]